MRLTGTAMPGRYFLRVQHRNHLTAMSAAPLAYTNAVISHDFTRGSDAWWGGRDACAELAPGVWGLMAGDVDGDGFLDT
jgi:hypothetical protein